MKNIFLSIFIFFVAFNCFANDETHIAWLTDMDAAQKQAKEENKLILVDFTGSDWCIWCIRLEEEVFAKSEFQEYAKDKFVFLMLDFPKDKKKVSEETANKNKEHKEKFKIKGFPTILLLNAEGNEVARTGYKRGGPENYIAHLKELIERYEAEKLMDKDSN